MSQNIFELKRQFLEYLEIEKGRSLSTIANYDRYLKKFLNFSKIKTPTEINQSIVRDFRLFLNRQSNFKKGIGAGTLSKKTQNYYLTALRAFLKYLSKEDIKSLAPEKIELAKVEMRDLDLISPEEFQKFMNFSQGKASTKKHLLVEALPCEKIREQAILETLFSTGMRISELCSLNNDLNLNSDEFSIRGKGGKVRIVFLSDKAKKWIRLYLKEKNKKPNVQTDALFIVNSGKRIYPRFVQRIIQTRSIKRGISKKITPHTIRHFFATDLLRNGADIRSVQMLLGHSSINTTQVYTNISDKFLKDIHKKFHSK